MRYKFKIKGFTLIELLVVISIIGILATLVVANLNSARSRARDAQRKSDIKNLQTALRLYFNDEGNFPASNSSGQIVGCDSYTTPTVCTWGGSWVIGNTAYMNTLPKDPLSPNQPYRYTLGSSDDTFTLKACLENASDASGTAEGDTTWCPTGKKFEVQP